MESKTKSFDIQPKAKNAITENQETGRFLITHDTTCQLLEKSIQSFNSWSKSHEFSWGKLRTCGLEEKKKCDWAAPMVHENAICIKLDMSQIATLIPHIFFSTFSSFQIWHSNLI